MGPIYDVNNAGMNEKFINTIIFDNHCNKNFAMGVDTPNVRNWQQQFDCQIR